MKGRSRLDTLMYIDLPLSKTLVIVSLGLTWASLLSRRIAEKIKAFAFAMFILNKNNLGTSEILPILVDVCYSSKVENS